MLCPSLTSITGNLHLKANITGEEELTSFPSLLWLCGKLSCFLFLNPPEPYVEKEKEVGEAPPPPRADARPCRLAPSFRTGARGALASEAFSADGRASALPFCPQTRGSTHPGLHQWLPWSGTRWSNYRTKIKKHNSRILKKRGGARCEQDHVAGKSAGPTPPPPPRSCKGSGHPSRVKSGGKPNKKDGGSPRWNK